MRRVPALLVLLWTFQASAEIIYRYRDKDTGRDVYVNERSRIPMRYRDQAVVALEGATKSAPGPDDKRAETVATPTKPAIPSIDRAKAVGSELGRAMEGKNLWKDRAIIVARFVDAKLAQSNAPPLGAAERADLAKLIKKALVWLIIAGLMAFTIWALMLAHALGNRHPLWALLMVLLWPVASIYLVRHAGKGSWAYTMLCAGGLLAPALVGLMVAWRFHAWLEAVVMARGGHL